MAVFNFEKDACKFHQLADESLLHIFSYLKYDEVAQCARVCRRWNGISKDKTLRKIVDLSHRNMSPDEVDKFSVVHHSQKITDLRLQNVDINKSKKLQTLLTVQTELRKLSLIDSILIFENNSKRYVFGSGISLNYVVHLSFRRSHFDKFMLVEEIEIKNSLPHLRCLDVGDSLSETDCVFLFSRIFSMESLRTFYLDHYNHPDPYNSIDFYPERFHNYAAANSGYLSLNILQVLDLESTFISSELFAYIINTFENLREFYVAHTFVDDEAFEDITRNELSLSHLCIKNTEISADVLFRFLSKVYSTNDITIYSSWQYQSMEDFHLRPNWKVINLPGLRDEPCYHYKNHICL